MDAYLLKGLPNFLTILRIVLIPVLVMAFYIEGRVGHWLVASIFTFASLTDYVDGILARRLKAQSNFGRVLDPIADKLLVASTLMMLVDFHRELVVVPSILILCREITVSGLREYLAEFKVSIPVSNLAKVKTAIQFISIIILILGEPILGIPNIVGVVALYIAALLTLVTGYAYCREGWRRINNERDL